MNPEYVIPGTSVLAREVHTQRIILLRLSDTVSINGYFVPFALPLIKVPRVPQTFIRLHAKVDPCRLLQALPSPVQSNFITCTDYLPSLRTVPGFPYRTYLFYHVLPYLTLLYLTWFRIPILILATRKNFDELNSRLSPLSANFGP